METAEGSFLSLTAPPDTLETGETLETDTEGDCPKAKESANIAQNDRSQIRRGFCNRRQYPEYLEYLVEIALFIALFISRGLTELAMVEDTPIHYNIPRKPENGRGFLSFNRDY